MYRKNGSSSLVRNLAFSTLEWQRKETSVPSLYIGRIRFATSTKVSFRLVQSVSIR